MLIIIPALPNTQNGRSFLKEMLAECGAGCWIEPPFHANWGGKHKHLGDFLLR